MAIKIETYNAGKYEKGYEYSYFLPNEINTEWLWTYPQINKLLADAAHKLGELNSLSLIVPNIDLFIRLHVAKEAVVSSRIEGTRTSIDEALQNETDIKPEDRDDWKEVNNYIKALNDAIEGLETLPISSRLLKQAHKTLMTGVRGDHKTPGEFRTTQNWIGGNSLKDAVFIPPQAQYVNGLMGDLENFLHNKEINVAALIQIAIAHYQFETIHPFADGNGRIGRLLITLFLVSEKILDKPLLYLSSYFEKNRGLYYDNLTFVRTKNDMLQWLKYFLVGLEETANDAVQTLRSVLALKGRLDNEIKELGRRSHSANILLEYLFSDPFVNVAEVRDICKLRNDAANNLIAVFVQQGILKETTRQKRNRIFVFDEYLQLFRD